MRDLKGGAQVFWNFRITGCLCILGYILRASGKE